MPGFHTLPTGPPLSPIECPRCPSCQARMPLQKVAPVSSSYDLRLFECDKCECISTKLVPSDPMKTGVAPRWVVGELKPPD
jgi:hypothetical protein